MVKLLAILEYLVSENNHFCLVSQFSIELTLKLLTYFFEKTLILGKFACFLCKTASGFIENLQDQPVLKNPVSPGT
jgi:membrane-anchored glycerophosphoryl diester phosphodiesterase (GDPDase)